VQVEEVSAPTSRAWVVRWHYSGVLPAGRGFGVFAPDLLAVVMMGLGANAYGMAARLGLTDVPGNLEVMRVVAHPDAPRNTASRSLAAVLRFAHRAYGLEWVFSYADPAQGHHGGIYQALNAVYVGMSRNGRSYPGFKLNGHLIHGRTVVQKFGTMAVGEAERRAAALGMVLERVPGLESSKHTYVLPSGGPASRRAIRRRLTAFSLPYPRRSSGSARPSDGSATPPP
jgi:hypothetical protein